jgi:hydrogenase expression/formation protein HypE
MTTVDPAAGVCPVPLPETERVLLGHGSGGRLSAELINEVLVPALGAAAPGEPPEDAAVVTVGGSDLVLSTDAYVVDPLFFPGGDIGMLAVHGTVNDLAMRAAMPVALTIAYIVEEGRGAADRLFVITAGLGRRLPGAAPTAAGAQPGDAVLISGPIGCHGITVLSTREGLGFEADVTSDTRPLHRLVADMVDAGGPDVHTLRDLTRGGLASALNEIAAASGIGIEIEESALPVPEPVRAACEMLGLDPAYVANEGCLVAFVAPGAAEAVLAAMRSTPEGAEAAQIGVVHDNGPVLVRTAVGSRRVLDMLLGEQLPRIC